MPILSMTGYGAASQDVDGVNLRVELRSVNHRFLDVSCKIPPALYEFESDIVKCLKDSLTRGHVDVFITRENGVRNKSPRPVPQISEKVFDEYLKLYRRVYKKAGISGDNSEALVLKLLERRELFEEQGTEADSKIEYPMIEKLLGKALKALIAMREREGKALNIEVQRLLKAFEDQVKKVTSRAKDTVPQLRDRFLKRIEKLVADQHAVDEARLAQEVAVMADKTDISEELARLKSHIGQFRSVLSGAEGGKKLDFLVQEMGREINTAGNKAQNSDISSHVVEAKALLEKIREQIQNIE